MSIKSMIKAKLKGWLDSDSVSMGSTVVTGAAGVLTIERRANGRSAILAGMGGKVGEAVLEAREGGVASLVVNLHGSVVHTGEALLESQNQIFDEWVKRFTKLAKGAKGGVGGLFKWVALVCAVLVGMTLIGLRSQQTAVVAGAVGASGASPAAATKATTAPMSMQELLAKVQADSAPPRSSGVPLTMPGDLPSAADEDRIFPIASLTETQLKEAKTGFMLDMKTEGKPFYVFSNPTCGACQHLEAEMEALKGDEKPVVIPVAFDAEGMRRGTAVMCSKDPVAAWKKMMKGEAVDTPLCLDGLKKMEKNSNLFASLGFQATPTVIAGDGRGAVGSVSSGVLSSWLVSKK